MDWSNLGDGPAGMIAERLLADDVADYVRFRAVCLRWRRCSTDPREHGILDRRFHPRRWIMLRGIVADPDRRRRLLNVSTGQCVQARLPELRGHDVCAPTVEGLLVLLNRTTYAIRLLNPLTRQVSDLPPATTLYPLYIAAGGWAWATLPNFDVSAAGLADGATVAVLFDALDMLAVAKPGDEQWTLVKQGTILSPAVSCAGRFYCTTDLEIQMVDIRDNQPPGLVLAATTADWNDRTQSRKLLDNDGELLLLTETSRPRIPQVGIFNVYEVSRVDLGAGKTQPICDLGGRAVFTGEDYAISMSPSAFPTIKKNSVYLENYLERYNVGCFVFTGPYTFVDGITMSYDKVSASGITEAGGFDNCIPRYGPHSIVDNLFQYVKRVNYCTAEDDTSDSDAEDDTADSDTEDDISDTDVEANCII